MIFASPDFGAGAMILAFYLLIWLVILALTIVGLVRGAFLLGKQFTRSKRKGRLFILASLMLPLSCCCGPSVIFSVSHGSLPLWTYPTGVIEKGMSADQVRALLGNPHEVYDSDRQRVSWLYYRDAIKLDWFMVIFGPDGKVGGTGGS